MMRTARSRKTVGFRWVIASREMTSAKHVKDLEDSYNKLGDGQVSSDASEKGASAVRELNTLAGTVTDKKLKEQLASLEGKLRASNQQQEEARDQAIRASLNLGAFLCTKLRMTANIGISCVTSTNPPARAEMRMPPANAASSCSRTMNAGWKA